MNFKTFEKLEAARKRRHRHIVLIGTFFGVISAILFGYEVLGGGTITGVMSIVLVGLADL